MKKLATLIVCSMTMMLTACGGDTHESLMDEISSMMDEMTSILKGVKDESSAKAAVSKLESLGKKGQDLSERMKKLGEPSEEQEKELTAKMMGMAGKAMVMLGEIARIKGDEKLNAILGSAVEKLSNVME